MLDTHIKIFKPEIQDGVKEVIEGKWGINYDINAYLTELDELIKNGDALINRLRIDKNKNSSLMALSRIAVMKKPDLDEQLKELRNEIDFPSDNQILPFNDINKPLPIKDDNEFETNEYKDRTGGKKHRNKTRRKYRNKTRRKHRNKTGGRKHRNKTRK